MPAGRVAIETARYALRYARRFSTPGSPGGRSREGALLRFRFLDEGTTGHADCFPWPELGDGPLDVQLRALAAGALTALTGKSLAFARADAVARDERRSLWDEVLPIPNHFAAGAAADLDERDLEAIREEGFGIVKVKAGRDLPGERRRLEACLGEPGRLPGLTIRLDYNGAFGPATGASVDAFLRHWEGLGSALRDRVGWVEDPVGWDAAAWERLRRAGVPLVLDRERRNLEGRLGAVAGAFAWCVLKPAVDRLEDLAGEPASVLARVAFTSYLDHPVGQAFAVWEASRHYRRLGVPPPACGLATHLALEPTPFSAALSVDRSVVAPGDAARDGPGIGFTALLDRAGFRPLATVETLRDAAR